MAKISVLGAGSWGTALSILLYNNGHEVILWSALGEEITTLREKREHVSKLPGVKIPEPIDITIDLERSLRDTDVAILAVPSPYTRSTCKRMAPFVKNGQKIVNVAKGVEEKTLLTLSDIIEQELPQANVSVLSGPSHAEEVGKGLPTTCVVSSHQRETAEYLQGIFMSPVFRVYTTPDMLGVELGAALKNVIALAAGTADGLGYGDNTKAALITRGIAEISRLGVKMGARMETFYGLSGIGDLIVTCASVHSRNRKAGYLMGKGYTMEQAMAEVKMIVEGVYSAKAAKELEELHLDTASIMKLIQAVNPDVKKIGLLYDIGQDSSTTAIQEAKDYLDKEGIEYVERTGTTTDEVQLAADALVADGVDAVFTPTDNTIMTAELSIYEKFIDAGIPQYTGADSFALNGAFVGYGVDYANLGQKTADMIADILMNDADPATTSVETFDNGTATVNTETCEGLGLDLETVKKDFEPLCTQVNEIVTAESFDDVEK